MSRGFAICHATVSLSQPARPRRGGQDSRPSVRFRVPAADGARDLEASTRKKKDRRKKKIGPRSACGGSGRQGGDETWQESRSHDLPSRPVQLRRLLGATNVLALWQKRRRALPSVRELDQLHRPAPTALSGGNSQPRHERTRIDGHQIVVVFSVRSCRLWYYRCKTYLELFAGHEPSTPKRLQFSTSTKQVISGDSLPAVTEILQLGANACGVRQ
jgi:hypothetical protein